MENSSNGDYIIVKVTIENYGDETYNLNALSFSLGKEPISLIAMSEEDYIDQEVQPGSSVSGYLYFSVVDANELTYLTKSSVTDSGNVKVSKYIFKMNDIISFFFLL